MSTITKDKVSDKVQEILSKTYRLMLWNDDHNSFEHVIRCLMSVCGHEYEAANQCAFIVHHKGVCDVKYGDESTISEMKNKLDAAGLSVTMELNM